MCKDSGATSWPGQASEHHADHGEAYEGGEDGRAWRSLVAPATQSMPLIH
jgi:hypothetical protein